MSEPTPSPVRDRGPYGVLFWKIVNIKTNAELIVVEAGRALEQLDYMWRELQRREADYKAQLAEARGQGTTPGQPESADGEQGT